MERHTYNILNQKYIYRHNNFAEISLSFTLTCSVKINNNAVLWESIMRNNISIETGVSSPSDFTWFNLVTIIVLYLEYDIDYQAERLFPRT